MKFTFEKIQELVGLPVWEAKTKSLELFNKQVLVHGENHCYSMIAQDKILLFVEDDLTDDENAVVLSAVAGDPTKLEN